MTAVDLTDGTETTLVAPGRLFRQPALAALEASDTASPRLLADRWFLEEP